MVAIRAMPPPLMSDEQLRYESVTGVDLTLTIAGPGTRSYAFVIDWHIRLAAQRRLAARSRGRRCTSRSPWRDARRTAQRVAGRDHLFFVPPHCGSHDARTAPRASAWPACAFWQSRWEVQPSTTALLLRNVFRLIDSLPATYLGRSNHLLLDRDNECVSATWPPARCWSWTTPQRRTSLLRIERLAANSKLSLDALELDRSGSRALGIA